MSFDTSQLSSSNSRLRFQDTGLEFDNAAGALNAAKERSGDEVVVGYVNEAGELKYALVDARTAGSHSKQVSRFDPGQLQFGEQSNAVAAFTVDDTGVFEYVRIAAPSATGDVTQQAEAALSLARAATEKDVGNHGFVRSANPGFRLEHSNLDWGRMVRENKVTVLDHVVQTMGRLDTAHAEITQQLQTTRDQGGDTAGLEARLARVQAQRSELDVHRAVLEAELLTFAVHRGVKVPGATSASGEALTVGAYRQQFPRAMAPLRERLSQVERDLAAATDPAARTSLEGQATTLRQTITHLEQAKAGIQEADFHQGHRNMALAQMGGALATAYRDLTTSQTALADLERRAQALQTMDRPYALRVSDLQAINTQIASHRTAINQGLDRLISTLESQVEVYAQHSGRGRVPQAAVALLRDEIRLLKELRQSGGASLQELVQKVSGTLGVMRSEHDRLVEIVSEGARNWDGVSPQEGLELLRFDADVQTYIQAKRSAQAQITAATEAARIPPPSHELSVPLQDQGNWNSCGTTSLSMVLNFMNQYHPMSERARQVETIDDAIRPHSRGNGVIDSFTAPNDIEDYVRGQGLHSRQTNDASTDDLKRMIDQGIPPIILTDWEPNGTPGGESLHYVVVTGYRVKDNGETEWLINNPNGYTETLTNDQLMKVWSDLHFDAKVTDVDTGINRLMITVTPPDGVVRNPNGDRIPVDRLQLPPRREPSIGTFIEIVNAGAGLVNDAVEAGHFVKGRIEDGIDVVKEGVGDAIDAATDGVERVIEAVIDDPLSIVASPITGAVRLLDL